MDSKRIRARFLDFFRERDHRVVRSSSLVPREDPTLLFANAGMNQFKGVFLGLESRDYRRAASVQKCMRVSGKHNDLEAVGRDARHHTFFEMLGNWSFGDYYKRDAIRWGWEFLTAEMGLPADRLWATVYKDDDESFAIWRDEVGLPPERIRRLGDIERGDEENFWAMAETGPCGPCTEIHLDQGAEMACRHRDGCALGLCDCDRWLELWNLVFMEFDRQADGSLAPLPMKSVDTGLGFERLCAVMQGVRSNYESDLFMPLIARAAELSGRAPTGKARVSMQVIADHARACAFTVADGAVPANEGRGYVVRRILRRAARHGRLLGLREPFLWRIADEVIGLMGEAYPELVEQRDRVLRTIRGEEERFDRTLDAGLQIYAEIRDRLRREGRTEIPGEDAFRLHDTYGFPLDLTAVVAAEDGLSVDEAGFAAAMARQRAASGAERVYREGLGPWRPVREGEVPGPGSGRFVGYTTLAVVSQPLAVREAGRDDSGHRLSHVLCAETPFYAESGGQVGDVGTLRLLPDGPVLEVLTTVGTEEGPACVVAGEADELLAGLRRAEGVELAVAAASRRPTMRHHTATHLLHAALRRVLGGHVEQAGSEVTPEKLRFDFRHDAPLTEEQLDQVERLVNEAVLANLPVAIHEDVPLAEARRRGAMALFGEKYAERVRVVEVGGVDAAPPRPELDDADVQASPFSLELCGGTHCTRTGDVGPFRILMEGGVAAGVRRIEAVAGEAALALASRERRELRALHALLRGSEPLAGQVRRLLQERQHLQEELHRQRQSSARDSLDELLAEAATVGDFRLVTARAQAGSRDDLLQLGDHARDRLGRGVAVLAAEWEGKATLLVTVTADLVERGLKAGDLVREIAARVGGRGGGKPATAQAGLPGPEAIGPALAAAGEVVREAARRAGLGA